MAQSNTIGHVMNRVNRTAAQPIKSNQDHRSLFRPVETRPGLCICFVFLALISALAQTPSQRNGPVKRLHPSAIRQGNPSFQPEPMLPPRFRGWRPRAAALNNNSHGGTGRSVIPYAASHTLQTSSNPPTLPANGFYFRPSLPAGRIPTAVATGDFNGDGKLDWAVSNGQDNSIWLYLGNGDGTSALPTILPTAGIGPAWMVATDLNGDGKLDFVVAEVDSSTVGVFLGNGDGTFQAEARYTVPAPPLFVLAGDFTGDGKLDIAAGMVGTTTSGPVAILPGDGKGHLGAALYTGDPNASVGYWLAAADLNGDGKLDLVVVDPDDIGPHGGAQAYLNNGSGTFTAGQMMFTNQLLPNIPPELALSAAIADLNNDGCNDVVMTESYGLAYVFNGNCDGTFATPTTYAIGDIGGAIELVDVNGDGNLDMVTSGVFLSGAGGGGLGDVAGNEVSVLFGDGAGHFSLGRTYRGDLDMYSLAVGDLNGDGFSDVITANQGSNTASVCLNDGKGGFGDPQGEAFGNNYGATNAPDSPFVFADVDGNGTLDMVVLDSPPLYGGAMQITTFLNDGTGRFSTPVITPAWTTDTGMDPGSIVLADFRNTGRPDILILGIASSIFFAPNIGGGRFGPYTIVTPPGAQGPAGVGDFNGDGNLDFVAVSSNPSNNDAQTLNVFLGNGDGTFKAGQSITFEYGVSGDYASMMYVGDFNRDGNLDVLVFDGGLYEFLGNGDGTFQAGRPLFTTLGGGFAMADLNRDGWPDMITATDSYGNATDELRSVFLGQPDGTFQYAETYSPYLYALGGPTLFGTIVQLNPFAGVVGDFNGDGIPDLALFPYTTSSATQMQILYGNGDGTFTPTYAAYPLGKRYVPQFAADLNGDGRADLIELDNYTASFNVVKSVAPGPAIQVEMLTAPVTGSTGSGRVILNVPSATATTVSFVPSDAGVSVPSVVVPAGTVSQDFQFSIGSGFNPKKVFSIEAQAGSGTSTAYNYVAGPPLPVMEFTPTSLIFSGIVYGASSTKTVELKNIGTGVLTISSIQPSTWFSETDNCGSSLVSGASCAIQVTFTSPFPGDAQGGLAVSDSVSGASGSVALEGIGISPLQIAPCCLGFSQLNGGASSAQNISLTNVGTAPIQVSSVVPTSGFSVANGCTTIAVGGKCQIAVTFTPGASGTTVGSLSLNTDVPNTTAFIVPLSGNAPDFSLGSAPSVTVTAGQTATYSLNAAGIDGFSGSISLSCGDAPKDANCTVSPSSVTLGVDGSSPYMVSVTTTAKSAAVLGLGTTPGLLGVFLAGLFGVVFARGGRHRLRRIATTVLLSACAIALVSCGGGSGGGGGGNSGTTPGTYSLTITGKVGSVSHKVDVTLIVQ